MCYGCYEEYGFPPATDAARAAAKIIAQANEFGPLHIAISDWNIENEEIDWLGGPENADHEGWNDIERGALAALWALTVPERAAALAICEGYIE